VQGYFTLQGVSSSGQPDTTSFFPRGDILSQATHFWHVELCINLPSEQILFLGSRKVFWGVFGVAHQTALIALPVSGCVVIPFMSFLLWYGFLPGPAKDNWAEPTLAGGTGGKHWQLGWGGTEEGRIRQNKHTTLPFYYTPTTATSRPQEEQLPVIEVSLCNRNSSNQVFLGLPLPSAVVCPSSFLNCGQKERGQSIHGHVRIKGVKG
jgi:hypothetical protein